MEKKRYQVFVSSTFTDLTSERRAVFETLMGLDCIPAGMELFGALDEEQFEFIKKVIDDCDYYVVIIGGRYGSVTPEGVSYTEKEYDYALSKGIKVLALLHKNPGEIPTKNADTDPQAREKLEAFREKVKEGRLVDFWESIDQLAGKVAVAMSRTIKMHPAVGWVRADQVSSFEALSELNELRKETAALKAEVKSLKSKQHPVVHDIAGLDESTTLRGQYKVYHARYPTKTHEWAATVTWRVLFGLIAPDLMKTTSDSTVQASVAKAGYSQSREVDKEGASLSVDDQIFNTVRLQYLALRLVSVDELATTQGSRALFWSLTPAGRQLMLDVRVVRNATPPPTE